MDSDSLANLKIKKLGTSAWEQHSYNLSSSSSSHVLLTARTGLPAAGEISRLSPMTRGGRSAAGDRERVATAHPHYLHRHTHRHICSKGVNDFAIFVGPSVKEQTCQPSVIHLLLLDYGIMYSIFLHLFLSSFTNPSFTTILLVPHPHPLIRVSTILQFL